MNRVLLLNASFEPLTIIPLKRAVVLLVQDKADLIEEREGRTLKSMNLAVPCPAVIKLKYYVKVPYRGTLPLTRQTLIHRDNKTCQYCGKRGGEMTIDHVVPKSRGGKHEWSNVVLACKPCNSKKADKSLSDMRWKLNKEPAAPKGTYWVVLGVKDPKWEPYLG